jgi:hypothetical protein
MKEIALDSSISHFMEMQVVIVGGRNSPQVSMSSSRVVKIISDFIVDFSGFARIQL